MLHPRNMKKYLFLALACVGLCVPIFGQWGAILGASRSSAAPTELELITGWPSPISTISQDNLGYTFTPSANITVTQLGHRRHGSQTGVITVELRLWAGSGTPGTLLASSSTIDVGSVANGDSAYQPVTPVSLTSGTKYYMTHPSGSSIEDQYSAGSTTKPDASQQNGIFSGPTEDGATTYYAEHNLKYTKP